MNTFELEIFDDEGSMCTFYSVRWQDASQNETEKFFQKFGSSSTFKVPIQMLTQLIFKVIGDEHGALEDFFRFENRAQALPPSPGNKQLHALELNFSDFPLRLYCLRLSDELVVLFNGGEKTSRTAQGGDTSMSFAEANQFADKIVEALKNGEIRIRGDRRTFENFDGSGDLSL